MTVLDWSLVVGLLGFMIAGVVVSRRYMRGVADFLAAGRAAGRYVLTLSQGVAATGAITIVATLEMNYVAGFPQVWWGLTTAIVVLLVTASGWVAYRFRETRCLTLAEFFERRYSRNFRVFAGSVAFVSGIINFGIFPAVGARFFIYFCGLPQVVQIGGIEISTFALTMIFLLSLALFFVFSGGQIAVIVADFIQGLFVNIVFVIIALFLVTQIDWPNIVDAVSTVPRGKSLVNPFDTSHVKDFNFGYFLIGVFGYIYGVLSWQGVQAYSASARSAHEAKMGNVLGNIRNVPRDLLLLLFGIVAYGVLHHVAYAPQAAEVQATLEGLETQALRDQLRVPVLLTTLLPPGLLGAFAAVMLAAFISTHDTYLHSWGSIFVQDVVLPLRKRGLTPHQHLRALRWSICGVAVFIFFFSLLFRQSEHILLFFAITGAIFAGGAGAVIIGGLYWSRGTTAAAWSAMITGSTIAVGGIVIHQFEEDFFINGQWFWALAMGGASAVYIVVSLLDRRPSFDLAALLHRSPNDAPVPRGSRGLRLLGVGPEFRRADRVIYALIYTHVLSWVGIFVVGTIYNLTHDVGFASWARFWRYYVIYHLAVAVVVVIWFGIGGWRDIRAMFRHLDQTQRDERDDGIVRHR